MSTDGPERTPRETRGAFWRAAGWVVRLFALGDDSLGPDPTRTPDWPGAKNEAPGKRGGWRAIGGTLALGLLAIAAFLGVIWILTEV